MFPIRIFRGVTFIRLDKKNRLVLPETIRNELKDSAIALEILKTEKNTVIVRFRSAKESDKQLRYSKNIWEF
ncbi:division/cell wall cluster transcriptional repressor MraZ [Candidatus Micrarchaeota archaeon]|nr:division/cell wall cluster transcriptional repressor MraZ [Candidatus Micrarchaeota archaeon]